MAVSRQRRDERAFGNERERHWWGAVYVKNHAYSEELERQGATQTAETVAGLLSAEWVQRRKAHALQFDGISMVVRWSIYLALSLAIVAFSGERRDFIYFQF